MLTREYILENFDTITNQKFILEASNGYFYDCCICCVCDGTADRELIVHINTSEKIRNLCDTDEKFNSQKNISSKVTKKAPAPTFMVEMPIAEYFKTSPHVRKTNKKFDWGNHYGWVRINQLIASDIFKALIEMRNEIK